jgi:hypothetical protein
MKKRKYMIKKLFVTLSVLILVATSFAGSVNLAWNPVTDPTVGTVKIYATPGTNTVFVLPGNTNATMTLLVSIPATNAIVTNLYSGPWSFIATCITTNGLESPTNSNEVWTNIYPGAPINLRFN